MSASDAILPTPCPTRSRPARLRASAYEIMTREELVDRLFIVEDQNHLLRLLNTTSINLLTVLRDGGAEDGRWERRVLEVGSNGASGAERKEEEKGEEEKGEGDRDVDVGDRDGDEEEDKEEDEEDGNGRNRAHCMKQQLLQALLKDLKPWGGAAVVVFFFFISKVIDFLVGLLTNYVFAKIMSE